VRTLCNRGLQAGQSEEMRTSNRWRIVCGIGLFATAFWGACNEPSKDDFSGVVFASAWKDAATTSFALGAVFRPGAAVDVGSCPADAGSANCCCSAHRDPAIHLPVNAGALMLTSTISPDMIASLSPVKTTPSGPFSYFEKLGMAWEKIPSDYRAQEVTASFTSDVLDVRAAGGSVHAFSGQMPTATAPEGIDPSLDAGASINTAGDFTITWNAGSGASEVLLTLKQELFDRSICQCTGPDAAGTLTLPASLMANVFRAGAGHATLELTRSTITTVTADNATIFLVGQSTLSTVVALR
jgi:hypothetical protein